MIGYPILIYIFTGMSLSKVEKIVIQ